MQNDRNELTRESQYNILQTGIYVTTTKLEFRTSRL